MKFIFSGVLVELILNFDLNIAMAVCKININPESRFVNYASINPEQFSFSESIIKDLSTDKADYLINNFSLNDVLFRVGQKINNYLDNKSL